VTRPSEEAAEGLDVATFALVEAIGRLRALLPSREVACAITRAEEALHWTREAARHGAEVTK
jgi:hypothetical protein